MLSCIQHPPLPLPPITAPAQPHATDACCDGLVFFTIVFPDVFARAEMPSNATLATTAKAETSKRIFFTNFFS